MNRLKELRKEKKLTQEELVKKSGYQKSLFSDGKMKKDKSNLIRHKNLLTISEYRLGIYWDMIHLPCILNRLLVRLKSK